MKHSSNMPRRLIAALVLIQLAAASWTMRAELKHRYSFGDATTSTNAVDSVGGATGDVYPGATFPGDGTLSLDGISGFVFLPDDLVSNYTSISFEVWTTPAEHRNWARLFDFGTNQGGKGTGGAGGTGGNGLSWIYMALSDGSGLYRADVNPTGASITGARPTLNELHHLVFTIDAVRQTASLYDNGRMVAFRQNFTATPRTVGHTFNDYIGRAQFADPYYYGTIDEFRIHDVALSPAQVEANYEGGANAPQAAPGALNSIALKIPTTLILNAAQTPVLLASYAGLTNTVDVSTETGITYSSDNTNVVMVGTDGRFRAVAPGTAKLQASYQSKTTELTVTVAAEPVILKHRYSFDGAAGSAVITDSVSGANGALINGTEGSTLGGGKLVLDGNFSSAYVELPAGIISKLTNATFKSWVTWDGGGLWQRIFDFGTNTAVGQNVVSTYLSPSADTGILMWGFNFAGEQRVRATTPLVQNNAVCVTVTYSYSGQTGAIYVGGRKVASGTVDKALFNIPDGYNWLGRAKYNDPYYSGSFDEFRIYSGAESDLQVAISAAAGPDSTVTDPGALQSISINMTTTNLDVHGESLPLQVLANFANVSNVDITTLAETSVRFSDPSVAAFSGGAIVPMNVGPATITASYKGVSSSLGILVSDSGPWPALLHRYTFNDLQGTTVSDSVGAIHGTFHGVGTFTGSQLVMPNPNPAPLADGTPNPAGGWVSFPAGEGMITGLPSQASIECWVVWRGGAVWQEIFDFGQAATPGFSLGGGNYIMVSPRDGVTGALRLEWFPGGRVLLGPTLPIGTLSQIVVTHDQDRQLDKLFLNGQLVASGVNTRLWTDLSDTDNWLARDQWPDAMFNGAYDDFRIWNGALTAGQVANLYKAGPNTIVGPQLAITRSGSQLTLRWPANASAFQLQSSSNLTSAWSAVSATPTVVDGLNNLTINVGTTPQYYRLRQ